EIDRVPVPAGTESWTPVPHAAVLDAVRGMLCHAGFVVRKAAYALSSDNAKMFATLDLTASLATGVSVAVGVRNSPGKSLALSFCAGSRVFVCDNLAFRSELLVSRRHTRYGNDRFGEAIARAVGDLAQFQDAEARRIEWFRNATIDDRTAESAILRGFEA